MSKKHLWRYVTEFTGRHNTRDADTIDMMVRTVKGMVGQRLRYRDLIAKQPVPALLLLEYPSPVQPNS